MSSDRLLLWAGGPEGRVTILAAGAATPFERSRALSSQRAARVIDDLATGARYGEEHRLVALAQLLDESTRPLADGR